MAKILVDIISVYWEGELVRIIVDDDIAGKATALRQIFGDDNVNVSLGKLMPDRSLKERNTALTLYKQVNHVMEEERRQRVAWVTEANERFKNKANIK